jgi:hypothetical protein
MKGKKKERKKEMRRALFAFFAGSEVKKLRKR